jgi:glycosyltransferase involved in cell wall biosynthesis
MRIGIDAHAAEKDGTGNATYIRNLVAAILAADTDHRYFLYGTDASHPFYREIGKTGKAEIRELAARNPAVRIPFLLPLATVRDRLDVLHVQFIAPPFHRGALVATIHDLGFLHVSKTFSRFFVWRSKILVKRTARKAARVITGSRHSRDDIVRTYGLDPGRVDIVPCGVAKDFFEPRDDARIGRVLEKYGIRPPYVLSVSRLNPRKNLPSLARAFAAFRTGGNRPHRLVIAGRQDFEARRTLDAIRSAGGEEIILPGFVADEDLPHLYKGADVFVYPSSFEGVGLPVLEALASGVPVVTSSSSSLPEMAGDAAVFIDPLKEEEIAAAFTRLADDPAFRSALVEKGRRRVRGLSWEAAARRTIEIYEEAAPGRTSV